MTAEHPRALRLGGPARRLDLISKIHRPLPTTFGTQHHTISSETGTICNIPTISVTPLHHFSRVADSFNPTMAPKRKPERKTGIHTLDDTPPSKKAKTTQTTPKATGLHTFAGSNAKPKANPSNGIPKKGVHTLANVNVDVSLGSTKPKRGGRSQSSDIEDGGEYVEDGTTLGSDDDDLRPELSRNAPGTIASNDTQNAHQGDSEGVRLQTRSQSQAATRHGEATRAKLMILKRLSRGTEKAVEKGLEADDRSIDGVDKERDAEV